MAVLTLILILIFPHSVSGRQPWRRPTEKPGDNCGRLAKENISEKSMRNNK